MSDAIQFTHSFQVILQLCLN